MNELAEKFSRSDIVGTVVSFEEKQTFRVARYNIYPLVAGKGRAETKLL